MNSVMLSRTHGILENAHDPPRTNARVSFGNQIQVDFFHATPYSSIYGVHPRLIVATAHG